MVRIAAMPGSRRWSSTRDEITLYIGVVLPFTTDHFVLTFILFYSTDYLLVCGWSLLLPHCP